VEFKTIANLNRFREIVVTLFKYGYDDIVERLDVPGKILLEKIHKTDRQLTPWERIRHMLEDLGPTFIKIGQILSQRTDLIPAELAVELRKLQDEVQPESYEEILPVVEKNLGRPLAEVFGYFDPVPLAAASLSQVHRAVLRGAGGRAVAVKVQRPGIRQQVETDLHIMRIVAHQLQERMETMAIWDLPGLIDEVGKNLHRELDFAREGRNMRIMRGNFAGDATVRIPRVFEEYSAPGLLIMDLIEGRKLNDLPAGDTVVRERLARRGVRMINRQILEFGFFHADPHPGNIRFLEDDVICLLDWGMVGRLTRRGRFEIMDLIEAVVQKDSERMLDRLLAITRQQSPLNRRQLERDLLDLLDHYHALAIREVNMGRLLQDVTAVVRENGLRLPADLAMMTKALMTSEGTARELYPQLNVIRELEPAIRELQRERHQPLLLLRDLGRGLGTFLKNQQAIPRRINQLLETIEQDKLTIRFRHENLAGLRGTLENTTNRLTFAIIIAALIIGSSMIITTGVTPLLFGFPALGIVGYLVSGVLGLWLVFNIIRSRKL